MVDFINNFVLPSLGQAFRGCGFCIADPEVEWERLPKRKCQQGHDMQLILYDAFPRGWNKDMERGKDDIWHFKDGNGLTMKERYMYVPECKAGCGGPVHECIGLIKESPYFQCLRCEDDACCAACGLIFNLDANGAHGNIASPRNISFFPRNIASPPLWKHRNPEASATWDMGHGSPKPQKDYGENAIWDNMGDWEHTVDVTAEMLTAFQNLVNDTYKPKATRDRAKLGQGDVPQSLKVVKVLRQEHNRLWLRYNGWKQIMQRRRCGWHGERKCTPVNELDGKPLSGFSKVHVALGGTGLDDELDANVNETYMFHGTSAAGAKGITETGFHVRGKAGSHDGLMFGPGAYLAEMSSKADEYASGGEGEYEDQCCMLLCRAVLGELYYTTQPDQEAIAAALLSGEYDSVLGDREAAVGTYREFVARRQEVLYPEFIIVYERVYADGKKRKPAKFTNRE